MARRKSVKAEAFDPAMAFEIVEIREDVRVEERCGGQCGLVAEALWQSFGWAMDGGVYLAPDGEPIGDHYWSVLPDGSILDATADQFCEGHDVQVVTADDPEFGRFRPEWREDYHPGHPDFPELAGVAWSGEFDVERSRRLRDVRGDGWWLPNPADLREWEPPARGMKR